MLGFEIGQTVWRGVQEVVLPSTRNSAASDSKLESRCVSGEDAAWIVTWEKKEREGEEDFRGLGFRV